MFREKSGEREVQSARSVMAVGDMLGDGPREAGGEQNGKYLLKYLHPKIRNLNSIQ